MLSRINHSEVPVPGSGKGAGNRAERSVMDIHLYYQPVVSLIAGILILIIPRLLNYIVAVYLIIIGIMGLIR